MHENRRNLPVKSGLIERSRLDSLLDQGLEYPLVAVTAGPGYGKTQAVSAWARNIEHRLIWFHLISLDNDSEYFWKRFIDLTAVELPNLAEELSSMQFPESANSFYNFLKKFCKSVYSGRQVVLILDNFNVIDSPKIHMFVDRIIECGFDNFTMVVISNKHLDLVLSPTRNSRNLMRITMEDVAFNAEETRMLFHSHGVLLPEGDIEDIAARMAGWPLAVYLLCEQYALGKCQTVTTDSKLSHIAELFECGYFATYSAKIQRTLAMLAQLPSLPLGIIQTIWGDEATSIIDMLADSVFVHFDYVDNRFHLHPMYSSFLSLKLFAVNEGELQELYATAGDWYSEHDHFFDALACYWKCGDYDRLIETIFKTREHRKIQSTVWADRVLLYLEDLPRQYVEEHPLVDFCRGFMYLNNLDLDIAEEIFLRLKATYENGPITDEASIWIGEICAVLGHISILKNTDGFYAYFREAAERLPGSSAIQDRAIETIGGSSLFYLPSNEKGQLMLMITRFLRLAPSVEKALDHKGAGMEYLYVAEAAMHLGKMDKAREYCRRAIAKAERHAQHDIACNAYALLIRIGFYQGKYQEMKRRLHDLSSYLEHWRISDLDDICDYMYSWVHIMLGDNYKVAYWITHSDWEHYSQSPSEGLHHYYLRALYLTLTQQYEEALAVLGRIDIILARVGHWSIRIAVYIMKAICEVNAGDEQHAMVHFWQAYQMAHDNHIVTPFCEFGESIQAVLALARASEAYAFEDKWLDKIEQRSNLCAKNRATVIGDYRRENASFCDVDYGLSALERQILEYLAQGMTREEIGRTLELPVRSVKERIAQVLHKLEAINCDDALRIAALHESGH